MDQEIAAWQVEGLPVRVEYSLAVMEELRLYGEEGFQKIPHGGIEVGALLFGQRDGETIRISEWRPIACDHGRGPGFLLSGPDRERLTEELTRYAKSPELQGLSVLGWFHTHTRSKIFLSGEDETIHEIFFGEPWQTALVMKPQKDQPPMAGFFCKDAAGVMNGDSSLLEFIVRPDVSQSLKPKRASAGSPAGAMAGRMVTGKPYGMARHERPMFRPAGESRIPATEAQDFPRERERRFREAPPIDGAAERQGQRHLARVTAMPPPSPEMAETEPPPPPTAPAWLTRRTMWATAALLTIGAMAGGFHFWRVNRDGQSTTLKIEEADQSLQVSWDNGAPAVAAADRAVLRIVDGSTVRTVPLSMAAVRNGAVTYMRQADDVEVRLTLFRNNQATSQGFARYVGASGSAASMTGPAGGDGMPPNQQRLQLHADVTRLREALREESGRAERLREELTLLERTANAGGFKLPGAATAARR